MQFLTWVLHFCSPRSGLYAEAVCTWRAFLLPSFAFFQSKRHVIRGDLLHVSYLQSKQGMKAHHSRKDKAGQCSVPMRNHRVKPSTQWRETGEHYLMSLCDINARILLFYWQFNNYLSKNHAWLSCIAKWCLLKLCRFSLLTLFEPTLAYVKRNCS